jgi:hypothetical protein
MPPVYDQGQLGSCHDDQTEVLTDSGWKLFSCLDEHDRLATVNPQSSALSYEFPSRIVRFDYAGDLVCGKNSRMDFRVTPDHKMLVRKWDENARTLKESYELVAASDLGWYAGLMNRVVWAGSNEASATYVLPGVLHKHKPQRDSMRVPMGTWLRFLGVYLAEGTMLSRTQDKRRISYKIQIAASKPREKVFVREVLTGLGLQALELDDRFTFSNKRVYEALASLGLEGIKAGKKFVPPFVFEQSSVHIKEFLAGHFAGDGSEQNGHRSHYTGSPVLARDIQRLVLLSGQESRVTSRPARVSVMSDGREARGTLDEHRVSVNEKTGFSIERAKSITREHYEGEVFCAEVPTHHTLITRRNGHILISGNCTGNAIAAAIEYDTSLNGKPFGTPSRLDIYYGERQIEGTVPQDSGAFGRDGFKFAHKVGVIPETDWPYDISKFTEQPPTDTLNRHKIGAYKLVPRSMSAMKRVLSNRQTIAFGFSVYDSFESAEVASTGVVPVPTQGERMIGGHEVLAVGYLSAHPDHVLVRNSWGAGWGGPFEGYFLFPWTMMLDPQISSDFRTVYRPAGT